MLWAGLAPLDEGVPAAGMVAIDTKRKAVQHLSGGIVQEVLVREGDEVQEGQLLIRLDSAVARANHESVRQRYLGLRAMQGRLLAEQSVQASIVFHPDLVAASIFEFEPLREDYRQCTPLPRAGEVEDVANLALFLLSDASQWITGQLINVDGGQKLRPRQTG